MGSRTKAVNERRGDAPGHHRVSLPLAATSAAGLYRDGTRTPSRRDRDRDATRVRGGSLVGAYPAQPDSVSVENGTACATKYCRHGYPAASTNKKVVVCFHKEQESLQNRARWARFCRLSCSLWKQTATNSCLFLFFTAIVSTRKHNVRSRKQERF